ncbi:hypothetical protein [Candidatus Hodarchaeum mangrovi]
MDLIEEKMKNFVKEALKLVIKDIGTKFKDFNDRLSSLEQEMNQIKEQLNSLTSDKQIPDISVLESTKKENNSQISPNIQISEFLGKKEGEKIVQSSKKTSEIKDLLEALKVIDNL